MNLTEGDVSVDKTIEEVEIFDLVLPLIVYDPLFQDMHVKEDAGEMSSKEEAPLEE